MRPLRSRSLRAVATAALAASLAGCIAAQPTHRYFQPDASEVGPAANSFGEAVAPRHGLIVVQGDELAYGLARGRSKHDINGAHAGQAATTISDALREVFGRKVEVENRGFPGDTVAASTARWAARPPGALLILAYGYGDMAAHTAPDAFRTALQALIRDAQAKGATVFVVLPPNFSDALMNSELAPYRAVASDLAQHQGAEMFDAASSMSRIGVAPWKAVAQRPSVYAAIAGDMAPYIKVLPASGQAPPQTGQAGSGDRPTVRATPASAS
jgi:hypothetical protein